MLTGFYTGWSEIPPGPVGAEMWFHIVTFAALMTGWAGATAAAPALAAIALAEMFRWRSVFFWVAFGGVVGFAGRYFSGAGPAGDFTDPGLPLFVGAGFAGGFVYWLIAGRLSGGPDVSDPAGERAEDGPR